MKILDWIKGNYILYENINPFWNDGYIYVFKNRKIIKTFYINDFEDPYEMIEKIKKKFNINLIKENHSNSQR